MPDATIELVIKTLEIRREINACPKEGCDAVGTLTLNGRNHVGPMAKCTECTRKTSGWKLAGICGITAPQTFTMGNECMRVGESETYLGVTLTKDGPTGKLLRDRVKSARARLEMLKRIGLNAKGFGPRISRSMYLTFIRPMFEYCCHLVPIKKSTQQEVLALEKAFFNAATGIYRAPLIWFRKLFKLEDFPARRISLRDKMKPRITSCSRINEGVLAKALSKAGNTAQSKWTETLWNEADK